MHKFSLDSNTFHFHYYPFGIESKEIIFGDAPKNIIVVGASIIDLLLNVCIYYIH